MPVNDTGVWYCVQVRSEDERRFREESFESREARTAYLADPDSDFDYIGRKYEVNKNR